MRSSLAALARGARAFRSSGGAGVCATQLRHLGTPAYQVESQHCSRGALWVAGLAVAAAAPNSVAFAAPGKEQSFIMVKPDGVNRAFVAEIIRRFETRGYKLVAIKVLVPPKDLVQRHYGEHAGKFFFEGLVDFLSSGAVVAMVWEGDNIVKTGRTMLGVTDPQASQPGTIRGDLGISRGRNLVHASNSVASAQKEIALWFKADEVAEYERPLDASIYE